MVIPIVFAVVFSLLTTAAEKPLCCYATERGWIVHELGSSDVHILRPDFKKAFARHTLSMSSKLTPSNLKKHNLSAVVSDNRLILEFDYDFLEGFPSNAIIGTRCRGEYSVKGLFEGKIVDQEGLPSNLFSKTVYPAEIGDLLETPNKDVLGIYCYEAKDKTRRLGWFQVGDLGEKILPVEKYHVSCPFQGPFKTLYVKERYYFVTENGLLYTSPCDQDGKPQAVTPVFLGFQEPIAAVVSVVGTGKVYVFTRTRYFELATHSPTLKEMRGYKQSPSLEVSRLVDEPLSRSYRFWGRLIQDEVIELNKLDKK